MAPKLSRKLRAGAPREVAKSNAIMKFAPARGGVERKPIIGIDDLYRAENTLDVVVAALAIIIPRIVIIAVINPARLGRTSNLLMNLNIKMGQI